VNVLLTGGAGNLGRYVHDELREHGHRVTLFDRFRPGAAPAPWATDAPIIVGELASEQDCLHAVDAAGAEAIVHLGGLAYATESERAVRSAIAAGQPPAPADATFRVNMLGAFYLHAAPAAGELVEPTARPAGPPTGTQRLPDLGVSRRARRRPGLPAGDRSDRPRVE
jgi:nucleoside-diphosphate-sugar epimerase